MPLARLAADATETLPWEGEVRDAGRRTGHRRASKRSGGKRSRLQKTHQAWRKHSGDETAFRYSRIRYYVAVDRVAVKEMHRQVGDLVLDPTGIARRGLLIRHLVMPGLLEETEGVLAFIARELSPDSYLNLIDPYHPCCRAAKHSPLDRPLCLGGAVDDSHVPSVALEVLSGQRIGAALPAGVWPRP